MTGAVGRSGRRTGTGDQEEWLRELSYDDCFDACCGSNDFFAYCVPVCGDLCSRGGQGQQGQP